MSFWLQKRFFRTYLLAWIVLALGLAITGVVGWRLFLHARELDAKRFHRLVRQTTDALRDRIEKYETGLIGLADFVAARQVLTAPEWRFGVRLLGPEKNYPGLLELGLVETAARQNGEHRRHMEGADLQHKDRGTNALYLVQSWVHPPTAYDGIHPQMLTNPAVIEAAKKAVRSGTPSYCYGRELSTEIAGSPARGFTVFVPVYEAGFVHAFTNRGAGSVPQQETRESRARGVIFGSIEPTLLLENLFGTAPREVNFDLFRGLPLSQDNCLHGIGPTPESHLRAVIKVPSHAEEWVCLFYTTPWFERESGRYRPWTAVATGSVLSALMATLLFMQIHSRLRQEAVARELQSACADLQRVQNERDRIGRDLHDGAIQSLYGLGLSLGQYNSLRNRDAAAAQKILDRCRGAIDTLIAELRTFIVQQIHDPEPAPGPNDTGAALQQVIRRFQSASSVQIELTIKPPIIPPVSHYRQIHMRQILQEALSNSVRHGRPKRVDVELVKLDHHLLLSVSDDGIGFDAARGQALGHGLANMQARAAQMGGTLRVQTRPGSGTQVILEIPLEDAYTTASE